MGIWTRRFVHAVFFWGTLSGAYANEPIQIVADEWPPFSGRDLLSQGIAVDVSRAVLERAGYAVDVQILPWARIVQGAERGEYDAVTSLFHDEELNKSLAYSDPFIETKIRFLEKKGANSVVGDVSSLKPYSITVGAGFLYEPEFDHADYLQKIEVTTALQAIRMVAAGRADLTLDSEHVLRHAIRVDDPGLNDKVDILDTVLVTQGIHLAVSRQRDDHDEVITAFNPALADMKADGTLDAVLDAHRALLFD